MIRPSKGQAKFFKKQPTNSPEFGSSKKSHPTSHSHSYNQERKRLPKSSSPRNQAPVQFKAQDTNRKTKNGAHGWWGKHRHGQRIIGFPKVRRVSRPPRRRFLRRPPYFTRGYFSKLLRVFLYGRQPGDRLAYGVTNKYYRVYIPWSIKEPCQQPKESGSNKHVLAHLKIVRELRRKFRYKPRDKSYYKRRKEKKLNPPRIRRKRKVFNAFKLVRQPSLLPRLRRLERHMPSTYSVRRRRHHNVYLSFKKGRLNLRKLVLSIRKKRPNRYQTKFAARVRSGRPHFISALKRRAARLLFNHIFRFGSRPPLGSLSQEQQQHLSYLVSELRHFSAVPAPIYRRLTFSARGFTPIFVPKYLKRRRKLRLLRELRRDLKPSFSAFSGVRPTLAPRLRLYWLRASYGRTTSRRSRFSSPFFNATNSYFVSPNAKQKALYPDSQKGAKLPRIRYSLLRGLKHASRLSNALVGHVGRRLRLAKSSRNFKLYRFLLSYRRYLHRSERGAYRHLAYIARRSLIRRRRRYRPLYSVRGLKKHVVAEHVRMRHRLRRTSSQSRLQQVFCTAPLNLAAGDAVY